MFHQEIYKVHVILLFPGYKQNQLNTFNDDLNPGLALLADWIISSGNTGLSVDMLTVYLEKLDREDVVEIIQKAQGRNCIRWKLLGVILNYKASNVIELV